VDLGAYQSPFAKPPPPPVANFSANPASGSTPLTVQFIDESAGSITSWDWSFGDGSADSAARNPAHTYTNAGNYTVTLTVTGGAPGGPGLVWACTTGSAVKQSSTSRLTANASA